MLRFHQVQNADGYRGCSRRGAEDAEDAGEEIGLIGIRLYCLGFIGFKFQMVTGAVLADDAEEGIVLFGFLIYCFGFVGIIFLVNCKRHSLQRIAHKAETEPPPRLSSASSAPLRGYPLKGAARVPR